MSQPPASASLRRASLGAVLGFVWDAGVFTVSDAMAAVGLTRSTTIDALDELVERGLVRELANARESGDYQKGRPARRFELRADAAVVVGIDAGRRHLTTVVADLGGTELIREHTVLTEGHDSADERRGAVDAAVEASLDRAGRARADVLAVCVGVPAPVDRAGKSPTHRDGFWRRMNPDLIELFSAWAPFVRIENDASLAAIAEGSVGAAVGYDDYVTVLAGERLGAGVVVDGSLLRGAHGGVGEMVAFDHVVGVEGAWGLGYRAAQWAREAIAAGDISPSSPLAHIDPADLDGRAVLLAAHEGDPDARRIVERVSGLLAIVTGMLGSLFDPRLVVVSGAISAGAAEVVAQAREALAGELDLPAPELVASTLGGDVVSLGAVAGALDLARSGVLDHAPSLQQPRTAATVS